MNLIENRHFWREHLQQWQKFQMKQSAYCRQHDLCPHKFSYYKQALLSELNPLVPAPPKNNGFIRVPVQALSNDEHDPLTLHFTNGVRLSGIAGNNLDIVKQLALVLS